MRNAVTMKALVGTVEDFKSDNNDKYALLFDDVDKL